MLETVYLGAQRPDDHRGIAPDTLLDELEARGDALRGARAPHVDATPYGGVTDQRSMPDAGAGRRYGFCSRECRALFEEHPAHCLQDVAVPA